MRARESEREGEKRCVVLFFFFFFEFCGCFVTTPPAREPKNKKSKKEHTQHTREST